MIVMITIILVFLNLILHGFQQNLKIQKFFDDNDVHFNAQLSLLK